MIMKDDKNKKIKKLVQVNEIGVAKSSSNLNNYYYFTA